MTAKPWIVLVGGFLGAGKTTLLLAAARELERRGLRSALILNDQGEALVDTEFASLHGVQSGEVTGGCFCCRFSDLLQVIDRLRRTLARRHLCRTGWKLHRHFSHNSSSTARIERDLPRRPFYRTCRSGSSRCAAVRRCRSESPLHFRKAVAGSRPDLLYQIGHLS